MPVTEREQSHAAAPSSPASFSRKEVLLLVLLLLVALLLRIVYLRQWIHSPYYNHPLNDELYVHDWAVDLLHGKLPHAPFFRAPLYSLFIATVYRLWGAGTIMLRVIQMVFGLVAIGLTYAIGRTWLNRRWAGAAAMIVATNPLLIQFEATLLSVPLQIVLDLAFVLAFLHAHKKPATQMWLLAGVCAGIAAITRPNILLPAVLLIVFAAWQQSRGRQWKKAFLVLCVFAGGLAIPVLPVAAFNVFYGGDRVLICSQSGINLYLGNAEFADGFQPWTPVTYSRSAGYTDSVEEYSRRAIRNGPVLQPSKISRYWTRQTIHSISDHPSHWMRIMWRKTFAFFSIAEIRNGQSPVFVLETVWPSLGYWRAIHNFSWLGPLALTGMILLWRNRNAPAGIISLYVLAYSASVIMFFVCSRFRAPLLPLFTLLGVGGVQAACQTWKQKDRHGVSLFVAMVAIGTLITNVDWFGQNPQPRRFDLWLLHTIYKGQGNLAAAENALQQALAEKRDYPDALSSMASIELAFGNISGAMNMYREALQADDRYISAWNGLASGYRMEGKYDLARQAAEKCLALDGQHVNATLNLAELDFVAKDYWKAQQEFLQAAQFMPSGALRDRILERAAQCARIHHGLPKNEGDRAPD